MHNGSGGTAGVETNHYRLGGHTPGVYSALQGWRPKVGERTVNCGGDCITTHTKHQ